MTTSTTERTDRTREMERLKQAGNPFRNFFARNPDDELCGRFHVPELYAEQRSQLLAIVELYRDKPTLPCEVVPVLGNKGAGKTHLLHSIKHGDAGGWQMLVTPGTYQKDADFLEYLLFQVIDTLLGGGKQRGRRPLEVLSEELTRRLLVRVLSGASREEQAELFPSVGLARWTQVFGLGAGRSSEKTQWLVDQLSRNALPVKGTATLRMLCAEAGLDAEKACEQIWRHVDRSETHNTAGLMRRHIFHGLARAALLGDESDLASFLTYGFAEIDYKVKPSRQDLSASLFRTILEVFQTLKVPVVVAFDQLEDLLLARREDDGRRSAEAFFAGIVQAMHQLTGLCFLVFAERGLWNRFIPSLDGYIQDRLNNPMHVPGHGTLKAIRLESPAADLVVRVAEKRLRMSGGHSDDALFPFTKEQVERIAKTEATLRDMLQQFRQLFDHCVYGSVDRAAYDVEPSLDVNPHRRFDVEAPSPASEVSVKSVIVVETPPSPMVEISPPSVLAPQTEPICPAPAMAAVGGKNGSISPEEAWARELSLAEANLAPEGSLTGATRELQAGLGALLQLCFDQGVKVGPWRLQHVVSEWAFGEHPTYGVMTIAHWVCKDGQPWKVGIGLFLGRGPGKPKDLEIKLASLDQTPPVIDHLILLRPEDDLALSGKSKSIWQESQRQGVHARLEPMSANDFAKLYCFPRWMTTLGEGLAPGQSLPNLADFIQRHCEKLLEQVCMPVAQ